MLSKKYKTYVDDIAESIRQYAVERLRTLGHLGKTETLKNTVADIKRVITDVYGGRLVNDIRDGMMYKSLGEGNSSRPIITSVASCLLRKVNPSPFDVNTKGILISSAYSSACCIPSPIEWLLSFASMTATGICCL